MNYQVCLLSVVLVLCPLGGLAQVQAQVPAPVSDCSDYVDDRARLACYDRVHGRPARTEVPSVSTNSAGTVAAQQPSPAGQRPALGAEQLLRSHLAERWDLRGHTGELFAPRAYRTVYMLPATWTDRVNRVPGSPSPGHTVASELELRAVETKYQISLKAKLLPDILGLPVSLWGGYTQSSRWQVYNGAASRPFRETNYEPEGMLVWPMKGEVLGWQMRMASVSLTHQSNGRSLPLSRSWNRIIGTLALERGEWVAELRPWGRIYEGRNEDDNPDILNYIGRGELLLSRYWGNHALSLQLRHSLRLAEKSRGSGQVDYVFPLTGALHGHLQIFSGYGESLIDYNVRQTKVGLGVTIAGWR
jgi:phospholipase A1